MVEDRDPTPDADDAYERDQIHVEKANGPLRPGPPGNGMDATVEVDQSTVVVHLVPGPLSISSAHSITTLMASRRSLEDAEAYELASVGSERSESPTKPSSYLPKVEEGETEDDALLSRGERRSEAKEGNSEDGDDVLDGRRRLIGDEDEIVGKGEGVETLIARVSRSGSSMVVKVNLGRAGGAVPRSKMALHAQRAPKALAPRPAPTPTTPWLKY